jgi:O-antigen ligase
MIKEKPLFGHGVGGFKANYMNYQARYFEEHPDSKYAMLADNVNRPFSEYLLLLTEYGLAGFALFLVLC